MFGIWGLIAAFLFGQFSTIFILALVSANGNSDDRKD